MDKILPVKMSEGFLLKTNVFYETYIFVEYEWNGTNLSSHKREQPLFSSFKDEKDKRNSFISYFKILKVIML